MSIESNAEEFVETFQRYASFAHSVTGPELLAREGIKLAQILYRKTQEVAPTIADITADVVRQGWRIPKKFPDGRLGRGTPDQWLGEAVSELPKRRGRKTKKRLMEESSILSSKPMLGQMQAFVIHHRVSHIGYVAAGWSPNQVEIVETSNEIDITNHHPGMSEVDAKHHVVDGAFAERQADMQDWIAQKFNSIQEAA